MADLHALILAGGRGTRFWPLSRKLRPKQLLRFDGERSLLRHTFERIRPLVEPDRVWVCTTTDLAAQVQNDLPELAPEQILSEPSGRNTAPAIAWAVTEMPAAVQDQCLVVLPSDHWIQQPDDFRSTLESACHRVDETGAVMTLGVKPRWPETGYGYVEVAEPVSGSLRPIAVRRFVEKPDLELARSFLEGGRHLWNAGIFLFRGKVLLERTQRHLPELATGLARLAGSKDPRERAEIYATLPEVSIDFGLMEKMDDLETIVLDCGWTDLGSWAALADLLPELDSELGNGTRFRGDIVEIDGNDNLLFAEHGTVAVLGVEGLAVIRTDDAVLVIPKERAQEVRRIVAELEQRGRQDLL